MLCTHTYAIPSYSHVGLRSSLCLVDLVTGICDSEGSDLSYTGHQLQEQTTSLRFSTVKCCMTYSITTFVFATLIRGYNLTQVQMLPVCFWRGHQRP